MWWMLTTVDTNCGDGVTAGASLLLLFLAPQPQHMVLLLEESVEDDSSISFFLLSRVPLSV